MLDFLVLGQLEIRSVRGAAVLRGSFQRTLLQVLLVSERRMVSTESLIREMWGETLPHGVGNALQAHASRLRRKLAALEPEREVSRLVGDQRGYRLLLDDATLDADLFVRAVHQARAAADPRTVRDTLRAALARWRGPALGGDAAGTLCRSAAARYAEYRIQAWELLFDSELTLGNHGHILGELREVCAENPLRERFCEQLMLALYRSGRQAEALETYRQLWSRLTRELGIEPSPLLRRTERAILAHDPVLAPPAGRVPELSHAR
ncbi:BTAD domain-containing putative transcriptional regulator [Streptomyces griseosporeus]|uniref:AfsR/SARP family transcriptional regulator n=1 Tax=Streptomyces griseosporeus TaxID=1910 RepID=UPI0036FE212D